MAYRSQKFNSVARGCERTFLWHTCLRQLFNSIQIKFSLFYLFPTSSVPPALPPMEVATTRGRCNLPPSPHHHHPHSHQCLHGMIFISDGISMVKLGGSFSFPFDRAGVRDLSVSDTTSLPPAPLFFPTLHFSSLHPPSSLFGNRGMEPPSPHLLPPSLLYLVP